MTDEQWRGILLMVRGMAKKCDTAEEVVQFIDSVLNEERETEKQERRG